MRKVAVRRSAQAEEDLIDIWSYIATESPRAADRFLDRVEMRERQHASFPSSAAARDDLGEGIRALVVDRYLLIYRFHHDEVLILRVLHGHRDFSDEIIG